MARRKKDGEYDFSYRSRDDLLQQKPTRQIKLPKIQQGPTIANGVPQLRKADKLHQQLTDESHRESKLYLPDIKGTSHNERHYFDGHVFRGNETQAKMMLVAGKMMKKYTNVYEQRPMEMASPISHDAYLAWHQAEENGWENSFDGYGSFYQRESTPITSVEREQELDKKRQAMLELKDKQIKFFRKCKQENLEAQYLSDKTKSYPEKQHHEPMPPTCQEPKKKSKRKKSTKAERGKRTKQNADDFPNEVHLNESHRSDIPPDINMKKAKLSCTK